jgi:hypothetical protein
VIFGKFPRQDNNNHDLHPSCPSAIILLQLGSNYLESGWQVQHPNSATVLIQLDGDIPERGHIFAIVVPFLHH